MDIPEDLANALGLAGEEVEMAASVPEAVREALAERDEARQNLEELTRQLRRVALADETPDVVLRRVLQEGSTSGGTLADLQRQLGPVAKEGESILDTLGRTLRELGNYKGFADDSQALLIKYVGEADVEESGIDVIRRITGELDKLRAGNVVQLTGELADARADAAENGRLLREAQQEAANLRGKLAQTDSEGGGALAQVGTLTAEVERLKALPVLPADAHARLVALPKIGGAIADQIIAALKAPAATPAEGGVQ
ncbi:hypothetical protein ASF71_00875 [Deinococcus sp. Leaf326]|nr:hypothetical protein ASF71_00875 [Deinococcus sp. Leaf326]